MSNAKTVLILKQLEQGYSPSGKTLSGIVRLETDSGITELSLSLVNLCALDGGEFFLYIFGSPKSVYTFSLSNRPTNFHKTLDALDGVCNGFACALVAVKHDIPITVAFGKTDGVLLSLADAKKLVAEKCLNDKKNSKRKVEIAEPTSPPPIHTQPQTTPQELLDDNSATPYDDEAVATVNYFELEEQIQDKLDKISERENDNLSNADGKTSSQSQKEKEENANGTDFLQDEADLFAGQDFVEQSPFYLSAKRELNLLFEKFPSYDNLLGYFPDSKWAKINYDQTHFYIVGVIRENKKEKYICYGVPAVYTPEPPKELKGYCSFIPLSIFDMQGEGFWMMFQDAITGESITPK